MKITIIAVGKEKDFPAHDLVREYTDRILHYYDCEWKYIPSESERIDNEKLDKILEKSQSGTYVVTLDEKGREFSSKEFSEKIMGASLNNSVRNLIFVIGGSYGLNDRVRSKADIVLALSKLTFPHQLVRLILAEQIYRACSIISGEKYHH